MVELARCVLRHANQPHYALDRLSRSEAMLVASKFARRFMPWMPCIAGKPFL
jgi:hypothetical protein